MTNLYYNIGLLMVTLAAQAAPRLFTSLPNQLQFLLEAVPFLALWSINSLHLLLNLFLNLIFMVENQRN